MDLEAFARKLPKAELHLHIEGTLEPEMMFGLAERNGVSLPFAGVDEVRAAYGFTDLQSFLDIYYAGAEVLRTKQDFHDLMSAYLARAHHDGVRRAEVFFDPQTHTERGVGFEVFMEGFRSAIDEAGATTGISVALIMCFLRHLPAAAAEETLRQAEPWLDHIVGVGLDSSERGFHPEPFADVFAAARAAGLRAVAHAGEEGPPEHIVASLDLLGCERIDHGVRAEEDAQVVARLARDGIPLTVCPLSNLALKGVNRLEDHNLARLLSAGVKVTVNSDDPAYFGGYIGDNYVAIARALQLGPTDLVAIARNSLEASFASPDEKAGWLAELDGFATSRL
jgi:adenosine deaminase